MKSIALHFAILLLTPILSEVLGFAPNKALARYSGGRIGKIVCELLSGIVTAVSKIAILRLGAASLAWLDVAPSAWVIVVLLIYTVKNDAGRIIRAVPQNRRHEKLLMAGALIGVSLGGFYSYSF